MLRAAFLATATALIVLSAGGLYAATGAHGPASSPAIAAAVGDTARPDEDTKRDADRHPALTLEFAGVKPGDQVVELAPGGGYFTRMLSAVVGPKGKVYAVAAPKREEAVQKIAADAHYHNVTVLVQKLQELQLPEGGVDMVWTSQNYHDFHNVEGIQVVDVDKKILQALKPGGVYLVLDHTAKKGSGFDDTSTLHRIDPEAVKKEVVAAGFKFEGASDILFNSADAHTAAVFDQSIRGHTDQFILKFRKPAKAKK